MKKTLIGIVLVCFAVNVDANIVGYVNVEFAVGDTLFAPPLWTTNNYSGPQYLSQIFPAQYPVPDGTMVSPWDSTTLSYLPASEFNLTLGTWSIDYVLNVGFGAKLTTSTLFTNTFVGEVDGRIKLPEPIPPVPHTGLGNGLYLLGNIIPTAGVGYSEFPQIIGRNPVDGEQIITLTQTYTYYSLDDGWLDQNNNPATPPPLNIGEAAFYNLGPIVVPEPTTVTLVAFGALGLLAIVRRKK